MRWAGQFRPHALSRVSEATVKEKWGSPGFLFAGVTPVRTVPHSLATPSLKMRRSASAIRPMFGSFRNAPPSTSRMVYRLLPDVASLILIVPRVPAVHQPPI